MDSFAGLQIGDLVALSTETLQDAPSIVQVTGTECMGEDQYSEDGGGLQQQYSHPQVLRWPPAVGPSTPGRSFLLPVTFIK